MLPEKTYEMSGLLALFLERQRQNAEAFWKIHELFIYADVHY
jgi:hypothetical protein